MLIYSENRLVPTDINMLVIGAKNGGYFYIHRALYDQAVIINDIYKDNIPELLEAVSGKQETRDDVEYFMDNVPSPIHILGPFLLLVKEELQDFRDMVGAIHVMSGPLNLRGLLKYPFELRNQPSFSLSIREEYELAWDRFFQTTMPYGSQPTVVQQAVQPMNGTATTTVPTPEEELSNVGDDGVEYADELEALLFGSADDLFDMPSDFGEEEETNPEVEKKEEVKPASIPSPASVVPEPEPEPAPVKKIVSGLDALRSGLI
ncbi:MAG: hypothetical protein NC548_31485 [Lachnospiraceae bacterium]|nr:hypothetical protein [Lachnospiraceae bacterium]